jgi:hypothetical protein
MSDPHGSRRWSISGIALTGARVVLVTLASLYLGRSAATVVHDHGSILSTVAQAMAYWAFALLSLLAPR